MAPPDRPGYPPRISDYRLYAIRVFTLKWEESVRCYRDVVGLPPVHTDEGPGWAQFQVGAAYLGNAITPLG